MLSWGRTAATLTVVALLFVRWADRVGPIAFLPATLGACVAILIGVIARLGARRRRAQFAVGVSCPPLWTAAAVCAISVSLAGAGLLALALD